MRLAVGRARFGEVEIDDLTVHRLRVLERYEEGLSPSRSRLESESTTTV